MIIGAVRPIYCASIVGGPNYLHNPDYLGPLTVLIILTILQNPIKHDNQHDNPKNPVIQIKTLKY